MLADAHPRSVNTSTAAVVRAGIMRMPPCGSGRPGRGRTGPRPVPWARNQVQVQRPPAVTRWSGPPVRLRTAQPSAAGDTAPSVTRRRAPTSRGLSFSTRAGSCGSSRWNHAPSCTSHPTRPSAASTASAARTRASSSPDSRARRGTSSTGSNASSALTRSASSATVAPASAASSDPSPECPRHDSSVSPRTSRAPGSASSTTTGPACSAAVDGEAQDVRQQSLHGAQPVHAGDEHAARRRPRREPDACAVRERATRTG